MMITAKAGFTGDTSWKVESTPIIIGRSLDCDIVVDESTVSRKQCEIWAEGTKIHVQNLSDKNPFHVNGDLADGNVLYDGDEFTIGSVVFSVSLAKISSSPPVQEEETITLSLADFRHRFMPFESNSKTQKGETDHAFIYQLCRSLATQRTLNDILHTVEQVVSSRFPDSNLWIFRFEEDEIDTLTGAREGAHLDSILNLAKQSLNDERAILFANNNQLASKGVMAAPLFSGTISIGSVVLVNGRSDTSFEETDLPIFMAIAELVGPFIDSITRSGRLADLNARLAQHSEQQTRLIGSSDQMSQLRANISKLANTPLNILISGESGTGKELVAQSLHELSDRKSEIFIAINCASIPSSLFESEMFGHAKGAFTGALVKQNGIFSRADRGTLFLDEVGELSPENQAKLLRVVEAGHFKPLGAQQDSHIDVRIISATNRTLDAPEFRNDLYHRLANAEIRTMPLRYLQSDIPILTRFFLDQIASQDDRLYRRLDEDAANYLRNHAWPGNTRELKNTLNRVAHLTSKTRLTAKDFEEDNRDEAPQYRYHELKSLAEFETDHIQYVMERCSGNVKDAAAILGISRSSLYTKIPGHARRS